MRHEELTLAVRAACLLLAGASTAQACPPAVTSAGDPAASGLDLRTAVGLANASSGCAITFDPSLNHSTITLALGQITITAPMAIVGPGADKLTISGANASRIFNVHPPAATSAPVTLSGLTLKHASGGTGGAIYAHYSPLVVQSSVVSGNSASKGSAIALLQDGYARLTNVDLHGNTGSAIYAFNTPLTIQNSTLSYNTGNGVIAINDGVAVVSSVIAHNAATGFGGGILANNLTNGLGITDSVITGNSATLGGGGVSLSRSYATFTRSQITHNLTGGNGGGILADDLGTALTTLMLVQSTIAHNYAYDYGAGIDVKKVAAVHVKQSLISGNTLQDFSSGANGGGIALEYVSGKTYIDNTTIYGNFAYNSGGGIGIFDTGTGDRTQISQTTIAKNGTFDPPYAPGTSSGLLGAGTTFISRSIIAGNSTSHGVSTQDLAGNFTTDYTLIQHPGTASISSLGGQIENTDPQLGPLAVNGGPTLTMLPATTSPIIGAGGVSSTMFPGMDDSVDQRGLPRPTASNLDIGAVQRQHPEDVIFRNGFD